MTSNSDGEGLLDESFHVRLTRNLVEGETLEDLHAGFGGEELAEEVDQAACFTEADRCRRIEEEVEKK